jgi:hypothetical protein
MDNLYLSKRLVRRAKRLTPPTLIAGVTRKGCRGFPEKIKQAEVKGDKRKDLNLG